MTTSPKAQGPAQRRMTVVPVMYRDAANNKARGEYRFAGEATVAHRQSLAASLHDGVWFVPDQLGMPHVGRGEGWREGDEDHAWHELCVEEVEVIDCAADRSTYGPCDTITEFVALMQKAQGIGWQPSGWGSTPPAGERPTVGASASTENDQAAS